MHRLALSHGLFVLITGDAVAPPALGARVVVVIVAANRAVFAGPDSALWTEGREWRQMHHVSTP